METKQIKGIGLKNLSNGIHSTLMESTVRLAEGTDAVSANFAAEISALRLAGEKEAGCMGLTRKSLLTDEIARQDALRDDAFRGLRLALKGLLKLADDETHDAARRLWQKVEETRLSPAFGLNRESGMMTILAEALSTQLADDVERLSLKPFVSQMAAANSETKQLAADRSAEAAKRVKGAMKAARAASDAAFRNLRLRVNAGAVIDGDEAYAEFIDTMNATLLRMKRESRSKNAGEAEAQHSPDSQPQQ